MTIMTSEAAAVIGGIDTHQDLHTSAVVDAAGCVLGTRSFSTTRAGYRAMLGWFRSKGDVRRVGVEATGTYGAGVTREYQSDSSSTSPASSGMPGGLGSSVTDKGGDGVRLVLVGF